MITTVGAGGAGDVLVTGDEVDDEEGTDVDDEEEEEAGSFVSRPPSEAAKWRKQNNNTKTTKMMRQRFIWALCQRKSRRRMVGNVDAISYHGRWQPVHNR
jgi:hypothetical protein